MPPKNINDFFSPVSTGTNPHQQIDDLILMEELDKIAQENMMYGAMTQFQPDVHAPTVTPFALDAELAPLKAMGWLLGKGKGIKDVVTHGKETIAKLFDKKFLSEEVGLDLFRDIGKNLPPAGYIERKANRLKEIEHKISEKEAVRRQLDFPYKRDEAGREVFYDKGMYKIFDDEIKKLKGIMNAENLRPGAGLIEDYFVQAPVKKGTGMFPFPPLEITSKRQLMDEGVMIQETVPQVEELGRKMLEFMDTVPKSIMDKEPEAIEYIRENWKDFDEYSGMKSFLDELANRMEARQSFLEEQLKIGTGGPY